MKACLKCVATHEDFICLACGGCPNCCKCTAAVQASRWVHIATKEGSLARNANIRKAVS